MGSSLALSGLSYTKQRLQTGEKPFLCGVVLGKIPWLCLQATANRNISCVKMFPAQYEGLGEGEDHDVLHSLLQL